MSNDNCRACDGRRLFKRSPQNPLLTAENWPYPVNTVFNAGAIRLQDGQTLLLARCEDLRGLSHLCAARSDDGITNWRVDPQPTFLPDVKNHPEEIWGLEDPRITWIPDQQEYAIAYTAYSLGGPGVSLAFTQRLQGDAAHGHGDEPGRQGRRPLPAPLRRALGAHPSAGRLGPRAPTSGYPTPPT